MSEPFLSEAWLDQLPDLAAKVRLGEFTGDIDVLITDAPGKVRLCLGVDGGRLNSATIGKPKDAVVSVEVSAARAAALLRDELDPAVAYMRGDVKLNDDYELVLFDWRSTYASDEWDAFLDAVRGATVFDS